MHNFKKVMFSSVSVLLLFTLLTSAIIIPFLRSETVVYQDSHLRDSLAGKIDFISIGASNNMSSMDPRILDDELGCFSYNLSSIAMTMNSKLFLLEKELERNPVKTVVIDLSYETLTRNEYEQCVEGDSVTFCRLSSLTEHIDFLTNYFPIKHWAKLHSEYTFPHALEYWLSILANRQQPHNVNYSAKGFYAQSPVDICITKTEAIQQHNIEVLNSNFREENIQKLIALINFCKSKNIEPVIVVAPVSDLRLWQESDQDIFLDWLKDFSKQQNCVFFDLNLLKNRYELFNDKESFSDKVHMSTKGGNICTEIFCDIFKKSKAENISQYFYNSYEDMKRDSPYMRYLSN